MPGLYMKNLGQNLLILIIILMIVIIYCALHGGSAEGMSDEKNVNKWNRNKCDFIMSKTLEDELYNNNIARSDNDWNLYFPCGYDEIEKEISLMPVNKNAKYFIIDNSDTMVAKELLWKNVVSHFGLEKAKTFLPNSYVLYDNFDKDRFRSEFDDKKIYIMKKNIQRQEGLKITNSKKEILEGENNEYVIVQELLQNPYIISGRKTNMRFYVLVLCSQGNVSVFVHKDGFMYYTRELFIKGSMNEGPNVTTGYIERKVYTENPLTHDDLRKYLDDPNRKGLYTTEKNIRDQGLAISKIYFDRIYDLLKNIFISFVGKICKNSKFRDNTMFQLFGVDVAVDDNLNPMVMEINKGPDLGAKDKRDSELKHGVVRDILDTINMTNSPNKNGFIKILDIKNT